MNRPAWRLAHLPLVFVSIFGILAAGSAGAQPTELFISEYIEGSSNNKAIEIYNGTGSSIDLAAGSYALSFYFNGAVTATTVNLTGTVAAGDVFVFAHSSANATILAQADQTTGIGLFNGDDAVVLRKAGVAIDAIGQVGFDPGTQWGSGLTSTADNTLRRKTTICAGDTNSADAFDPSVEWDGFAVDTVDDLGSYAGACRQPVINEFSASTAGTDVEYVEILGSPNTDLSTFRVLEIEGDSGAAAGTIDEVIVLGTTDADGYYLANLAPNALENGTITLLLVEGFSGALNTDLDTNNDGVFDSTPWTRIVDAVAVNDGGAGDITYGVPALGVSYDGLPFAPGGASRIPNGIDTNTAADWVRNDFDLAGIPGFTGTLGPGEAVNTPGAVNQTSIVDLAPSVSSTIPADGGAAAASVTLSVTFSEAVDVTDGAFKLECPAGTPVTFTVSPVLPATGETAFTIDPTADLPSPETCTATVNAANVTDSDLNDPPDNMPADYTWTFTTVGLSSINAIQGPGAASPVTGSVVRTSGIVTAVKSNGFFIQEPDASVDADPMTSEGIFVFTSAAPPAAAAVGNLVEVVGTVAEFVPSSDPLQPPLTELTSPTVTLLSAGNPLPAPIELSASFPSPGGSYDQLERLEGMRVSVPSMTVVGPTSGSYNEPNATATSNGVFYGVVTGVARPFREAGIQPPDPAPSGSIPPIPRFDGNPELIRVDSDALAGTSAIDVGTGAVVANVVGPLDYGFRHYTILPESTLVPVGGPAAAGVTAPTAPEFTVASYNLQRFFDTVNDPGIGEPVLTAAAYARRLDKASLHVRNFLGTPDVLGVVEVENLTTLQDLATQINNDAVAALQPSPGYVAYLVEGNDVGGIDVGFLVKTAEVAALTPRVEVVAVTQELAGTLFTYPDAFTELLNDRPPLMLRASIHHTNGTSFPVTVIVNHMRSLNDVDSTSAGSHGFATLGERVRAKRLAQANDLASFVQSRQLLDPAENIILVGDFNAFEVNDGYVHSMATIAGSPAPDDQTVVPGDGIDLVTPDLVNLTDLVSAAARYGYVFDGNAQNLDHILVNAPLVAGTVAQRLEHARINADFAATDANGATTRLSDHDPVVAFIQVAAFASTDVSTAITDSPDPVFPGTGLTYTITVANAGPDAATSLNVSNTLPAGTVFASLTAPAGWTCTTPAIGATGTVSCSIASFPSGGSEIFTLGVTVDAGVASGTILSSTASATQTSTDLDSANDASSTTTTVQLPPTAVRATKVVAGVGAPGAAIVYTITLHNLGVVAQADNPGDELVDVLPPTLALVSASATSGTAVTEVATNTVRWNGSIPAGGSVTIRINATIGSGVTIGQVIANQATASYDADGNGSNESSAVSDDPSTGAAGDATLLVITQAAVVAIPALDGVGLSLLILLVAMAGVMVIGRRVV